MLSSALVFAASTSLFALVQGQFFEFTALDDYYSSGCNQNSPMMYKVVYGHGVCHKGSPNFVNGRYYGSTTCNGGTDGSFMFQSYNGTISDSSDATIVMKHFTDSACVSPVTPFVSTMDTLSAKKGCIVSSLNFVYPIKVKFTNEIPQISDKPSVKIPSVACKFPSSSTVTSTTAVTSTSTAGTSSTSAASSVTETASSATGSVTASYTSSTATNTGTIISAASSVTGSMIGVAAVAIIMSSFV